MDDLADIEAAIVRAYSAGGGGKKEIVGPRFRRGPPRARARIPGLRAARASASMPLRKRSHG